MRWSPNNDKRRDFFSFTLAFNRSNKIVLNLLDGTEENSQNIPIAMIKEPKWRTSPNTGVIATYYVVVIRKICVCAYRSFSSNGKFVVVFCFHFFLSLLLKTNYVNTYYSLSLSGWHKDAWKRWTSKQEKEDTCREPLALFVCVFICQCDRPSQSVYIRHNISAYYYLNAIFWRDREIGTNFCRYTKYSRLSHVFKYEYSIFSMGSTIYCCILFILRYLVNSK